MTATIEKHRNAIWDHNVTKTNVIGLRKALSADWRRARGYSVGPTSIKVSPLVLSKVIRDLDEQRPIVRGELHASGVRTLTNGRYKKRLAVVADKIAQLTGFCLIGFHEAHRGYFVPVYEAWGYAGKFTFYVVPWQSAQAYGLESGPTVLES